MDRGSIDNYLHKKFKKQLSIEPKSLSNNHQQNDKENKDRFRIVDPGEEKGDFPNVPSKDNNKPTTVPNHSTNSVSSGEGANAIEAPDLSNNNKSSISSESGNFKLCISKNEEILLDRSLVNFDISTFKCGNLTTKLINSNSSSSPSEVPAEYYSQQDRTPPLVQEEEHNKCDQQYKNEDTVPQPEKNPNGKYVCHYCNLVCAKPSVLQKHIRAHTNERPYPCTSCGFSFKTRSNLYKHCRSRTHANRVMGVKAQENVETQNFSDSATQTPQETVDGANVRSKPYKPRFHTVQHCEQQQQQEEERTFSGTDLSHHINEIISKNNSIVNSSDPNLLKRRFSEVSDNTTNDYNRTTYSPSSDEPLNLTNKNRKRCMSEAAEPVMQKSLIKELLLKNLYSDMQCPYCKMIFQTVTELELHKLRSCKGKPSEAKYTRSSSVNVASILTKNKNAFDNIPQFQSAVFPLSSPGPFLGKTRLVDGDKNRSFSFDSVNVTSIETTTSPNYVLSPVSLKEEKKPPVRMFGGEVKIQNIRSGQSQSYRIDSKESNRHSDGSFNEFESKMNENRVVKSTLQSGGTVLTNKTSKEEPKIMRDVIRVYENTSVSPNIDMANLGKPHFNYDSTRLDLDQPMESKLTNESKYPNRSDFCQNAVKLLAPNLKHPTIHMSGMMPCIYSSEPRVVSPSLLTKPKGKLSMTNISSSLVETESDRRSSPFRPVARSVIQKPVESINSVCNPMNLLVNGKIVRYVPGMPGPVAAEVPMEYPGVHVTTVEKNSPSKNESSVIHKPITPIVFKGFDKKLEKLQEPTAPTKIVVEPPKLKSPSVETSCEQKKFARPNSLALKPTTASLKQHHGLTPTIFNQILISPDTPRVEKKYAQHLFDGNYFSYLGLKSSTKPVYCTLNKTQPFYVPHFKKLSMYSEWRQQDTKVDKMYVSAYDSRQRNQRYTTAGRTDANLIIHSSYKYSSSDLSNKSEKDEDAQKSGIVGGYECNEESPYIRGRGRGRYVCEQCGIRCKKPSMLKKHIRTHSNDRPYACNHCNFSFKTKGNLTKHMKSKSHTKNYTATSSGSGSSTRLSGSQSSDSDTDDSGMDSSDESMTRQQEHEAAYGLLSLSQKTSVSVPSTELLSPSSGIIRTTSPASSSDQFITSEEVAYVSKTNYAKNKILDNLKFKPNRQITDNLSPSASEEKNKDDESLTAYLGKTTMTRPLTYPYTCPIVDSKTEKNVLEPPTPEPKSIKQFHVIQKYAKPSIERESEYRQEKPATVYLPSTVPTLKVNDVVVEEGPVERKRKIAVIENSYKNKLHRNDEVMDLSINSSKNRDPPSVVRIERVNQYQGYDTPRREENYQEIRVLDYRISSDLSERKRVEELNYRNLELNRKITAPESMFPNNNQDVEMNSNSSNDTRPMDYDNSAMETLAEVATKQVKLDKNMMAKNVASEFLKLATQIENLDGTRETNNFIPATKEAVNDLIVKSEGNKSCTICSKSFNKPFQLRLHMNIHYLERPFRCDSCSVSFRTKGHLQKHERSASHYSKLSSAPAQSSSEPRPFKCSDCNIAFRIHGHLAKHLRSKMHIMKLECLAKIPFGLYAELERSNSLLTEINTSDGDQCLESLKTLAKKVFMNDPEKLQTLTNEGEPGSNLDPDG
ncbi:hypothetical protein ABEB36_002556 [Hypothenemus hampei]|uniref:C2H2-type domain-containing protein n=1 Tax=Hypothenemus hampei TaxID=57062 RepID=A0ABD1F693_HYPHA